MLKNLALVSTVLVFLVACGGSGDSGGELATTTNTNEGKGINKNRVKGETYPDFYFDYKKYPRIAFKDSMVQIFGTNKEGIVSYGLEELLKGESHMCPVVAASYLISREGINALKQSYVNNPASDAERTAYDKKSGLFYRGGIKVSSNQGAKAQGNWVNALTKAIGFVVGAEAENGFNGPGLFGHRKGLISYTGEDPKGEGDNTVITFTSMKQNYVKGEKIGDKIEKTDEIVNATQCDSLGELCLNSTKTCDRTIEVTYNWNIKPLIAGAKNWPEKIQNILNGYEQLITVKEISNPANCDAELEGL